MEAVRSAGFATVKLGFESLGHLGCDYGWVANWIAQCQNVSQPRVPPFLPNCENREQRAAMPNCENTEERGAKGLIHLLLYGGHFGHFTSPRIFGSLAAVMFNGIKKEDIDYFPYEEGTWR
ncbi:unnamed protein product [Prunus armeniaca]